MPAPFLLAAAALGSTGAGFGPPPANPPITLAIERTETGVTARVVGRADAPVGARYRLEMSGGGNSTVQRGSVRLRGGETVTLLTASLGQDAARAWRARLTVEPEGMAGYEIAQER